MFEIDICLAQFALSLVMIRVDLNSWTNILHLSGMVWQADSDPSPTALSTECDTGLIFRRGGRPSLDLME